MDNTLLLVRVRPPQQIRIKLVETLHKYGALHAKLLAYVWCAHMYSARRPRSYGAPRWLHAQVVRAY